MTKGWDRIWRWAALVAVPVVGAALAQSTTQLRLMIVVGAGVTWLLLRSTERNRWSAEAARAEIASQARFAAFVQRSSDVVTVVDDHNIIRYQSPAVTRVFGYSPTEHLGVDLRELLHPEDRRRVFGLILAAQQEGRESELVECRVRHADGSWRHAETAVSSMLHDPDVRGVILNTRDISERKALEEALAHQAFHDSLTKLANRALLKDRIDHALARAARRGRELAVMLLDLDGFKAVNDSLGHDAGDELLVAVAGRLLECVRPTDTAARLGGDEFAVLIEDLASPGDYTVVAGRVLESLQAPFHVKGKDIFVRGSIGIAMCGDGENTADALLRNADVAMYMAKAEGKNRFELFNPSMHSAMLERLDIEADLRRAVERREFVLHYQPTVVLQTGRIAGVEALVRWDHPERGLVPPIEFISIAEETGLIVPLGEWVLREACAQTRRWHLEHPKEPPLKVSVNLSARQLQQEGLVRMVQDVLAETGLDPSTLTLEITESAVMNDHVTTIVRLNQLKALGVRIAVDDFGTGYSSLSYLRRFPIDVLKIDRTFVDGVADGPQKRALLRTIVDLGRTLNLETVAEGIELPEELQQLRSLDCELGQGYYFARPLDADGVEELLARGELSPTPVVIELEGGATEVW
ncbi:MAG TPA: EAL domain-containing protein [Acidimicrobiales bacterium]|nr:EAL domain-containing protein [Acidimicrobiales bacterium]